jgi:hypothetical protein
LRGRKGKLLSDESLNVWFTILREKYGVKQSEITNFTQTAVLKLEKRKNIRVSTLIDYLDSLGMRLEINTGLKILPRWSYYCGYEL